jgi:single-stranded-DNA-specific exonuclease
VDKYHKPAIVISLQEGKAMGSCRSVLGFDICRALKGCSGNLLSFGGHAMAAGLSVEPDKIEAVRFGFNDYARRHLGDGDLVGKLDIDAQVSLSELDLPMLKMIECLGPFGEGNPAVRLLIQDLRLANPPRRIGKKGNHLQLTIAAKDDHEAHLRPGGVIRAVAFGKAKWEKKLLGAESFDLVFQPVINRFNGNMTVEMIAEDIRIN